jgi:hypothetical protein
MPNGMELVVALALPILILTALRINAAMVFLSLCLGQVLVQTVGTEAITFINFVVPNAGAISQSTAQLIMLFAPAVLTSIFMALTIHGKLRVALNVIPATGVGALVVLLGVPLLTPGLRYAIQAEGLWHQLFSAQALIITIAATASLLFLWSQRRSARQHEKPAKHH